MNSTLNRIVLTLSLACLLASASPASTPPAEKAASANIGFVLYTRSPAPGTLNARWIFGADYRGPGLATGGPREGYVGRYHVRYFLESGEFSDEYDLVIEKTGDVYHVSWITGGKVAAVGVGMETGKGLAVGWRRVAD